MKYINNTKYFREKWIKIGEGFRSKYQRVKVQVSESEFNNPELRAKFYLANSLI